MGFALCNPLFTFDMTEERRRIRHRRFNDGQSIVLMHGGTLDTKWIGFAGKFHIRCQENHQFVLNLYQLKQGSWCTACNIKFPNVWFTEMQTRAEKMGGFVTSNSSEYKNAHSSIALKCARGHGFCISLNNLTHGKWCPHCVTPTGESIAVWTLSKMLGVPFTKVRPQWLKFKTQPLELDGYNDELKIAIEYQGVQHYKFTPPFHSSIEDLYYQQKKDNFKREACQKNNILLIEVPYKVHYSRISQFLKEELVKNGINITEENPIFKYEDIPRVSKKIGKLNELIESKNAKLLTNTPIVDGREKVVIQCNQGHVFKMQYAKRKHEWCKECSKQVSIQ